MGFEKKSLDNSDNISELSSEKDGLSNEECIEETKNEE